MSSFNQDPRFCLSVMAEIACRALSPAVNDPGTAIDVIGRGVRVLTVYGNQYAENGKVRYTAIHIAPLSASDLLDDFFSPIARDGAAMREIQIRLLKGLAMLSHARPEFYAFTANAHAREALHYIERENHIVSDDKLILETCRNLLPQPH